MRLAWLSDLHLDTLGNSTTGDARPPVEKLMEFAKSLRAAEEDHDGLVFTGDVADGHETEDYFAILGGSFRKPFYFVLGNHDYYGGSLALGKARVRRHIAKYEHLHWLTEMEVVGLDDDTCILGHDGMYDGRMGLGRETKMFVADFQSYGISDFFDAISIGRNPLFDRIQTEAQKSTDAIEERLMQAIRCDFKRILIVTHVPPFHEASYFRGRRSPDHSAPWYGNDCLGEMLLSVCRRYPEREFLVLCGHSHARRDWYALDNLFVRCGKAKIGRVPTIQGPIEW